MWRFVCYLRCTRGGEAVAEAESVALNQLINVAVAEKLSALRTDDYFRVRAARGSVAEAKRILKRTGRGKSPVPVTSSSDDYRKVIYRVERGMKVRSIGQSGATRSIRSC